MVVGRKYYSYKTSYNDGIHLVSLTRADASFVRPRPSPTLIYKIQYTRGVFHQFLKSLIFDLSNTCYLIT